MKKIFTLTILMLFMTLGFSQNRNKEQGDKLPGSVKLNSGEVIEGYILRYSKIKSQKKVHFYKNIDSKDYTEYKPEQLISYQVADAYYQSLPYEGFTQKTKVFIERSLDGKVSLFTYYIYVEELKTEDLREKPESKISLDFDGKKLQSELIMLKENNEQLNLTSMKVIMGFKNIMSKYLSECNVVSNKIANKEDGYGVLSIMKIVKEYNLCF